MENDLFRRIPGLLTTFSDIELNGFFGTLEVQNTENGGPLIINVVGYIRDDASDSPDDDCGIEVDFENIAHEIQRHTEQKEVINFAVVSKTENWPLWNEERTEKIGNKGTKTTISIGIYFKKRL